MLRINTWSKIQFGQHDKNKNLQKNFILFFKKIHTNFKRFILYYTEIISFVIFFVDNSDVFPQFVINKSKIHNLKNKNIYKGNDFSIS